MSDRILFASVVALLMISLVMSYSLTTFICVKDGYSQFHFLIRQGVAIAIGIVAMVTLSLLETERWLVKVGATLFFVGIILVMVMPLLPSSMVPTINGAKRWIHMGPMSLMPVEFLKIGFVFFLAWGFSLKFSRITISGFKEEVIAYAPYLILFGLVIILIGIFQKDIGQISVMGVAMVVLFAMVGSSWRFFGFFAVVAMVGFTFLVLTSQHRMARIASYMHSFGDSSSASHEAWNVYNALNGFKNGGLFGQWFGDGQLKLGYIPEIHTDFILAGVGEELGLLGLGVVVLLILTIVYRIFLIASRASSHMHHLFCVGIGALIAVTFMINALGVTGVTPVKGIAVPFLSYGGSHIIALCIAMGMVLMISKETKGV